MDILDHWGDHVPYQYRNIYKRDWNWNPIDEAPVHAGRGEYWPRFTGVDVDLDLEDVGGYPHDEEDDDYEHGWDDEDDGGDEEEDEEDELPLSQSTISTHGDEL
mmetsp:Transcript_23697/g.48587  ORF Transcript_23697/g.48587 Transcript_23697/m.48587 type:complete len:104 (-) Transcript_23697:98-409(-)